MGKAAEELNISQPAVSRAVADLEHAIGVRLLDRSRQGAEPTEYGRALFKRGTAIFDELGQGIKDIEYLASPTVGEVRLGSSDFVAAGPVSIVIDRLSRQHPGISLITYSLPLRHYLVATGRFITVLPRSTLQVIGKRLSLRPLAIELPARRNPVVIVTLKNRSLSPLAQLFIDCAREVAKTTMRQK